ncbi:MinD/ParA family protein [Alkalihalobacterium elongatum]|uniref:MinD/ParA family protein n=1 Tax=Alkalihalobacterium elongatum TaxID=2675466 RepID=UPI001C1FDA48|nr:MinD/ParA family protein [Alkalihalobacterium elongatum]
MNDQAESLRRLMDNKNGMCDTKVISVISGKGGVGKSNFSINFSLGLSRAGFRVLLFDLDIGMANVDILMGMTSKYNIVDMIENELTIWDIIEKGPGNVSFISGGSGFSQLFKLSERKLERFVTQLETLKQHYDYIIFDMGAGISEDSLQFILSGNEAIMVTTPEPTSITDAYAMLKYINNQVITIKCSLIVNRTETEKEGKVTGENFQRVVKQFLQKEITYLGSIPNDNTVKKAVRSQLPFLLLDPKAKSSRAVELIVQEFIGEQREQKSNSDFNLFVQRIKSFFSLK